MDSVEQFEERHRKGDNPRWGNRPHPFMEHMALRLPPASEILDLGAGEGRHTLYLARLGHEVTAVDIAPAALGKLYELAYQQGVTSNIRTEIANIVDYLPPQQYDVVLSTAVLHFLSATEYFRALFNMQAATKAGGINVLISFNKFGMLEQTGHVGHLLDRDELPEFYHRTGWTVEAYETLTLKLSQTVGGDSIFQHASAVVARKN